MDPAEECAASSGHAVEHVYERSDKSRWRGAPLLPAKKEKETIDGRTSAEDGDDVYGVEVVGDDMLREDGAVDANL